jgi:hypothetical protein
VGDFTGIDGRVYAGSRLHYYELVETPRFEDYEFTYVSRSGNRFEYLGNGWTRRELEKGDLTWYLDEPEENYLGVSSHDKEKAAIGGLRRASKL